ncbi:MAG: hypothetical protein H7A46_18000 [Verrucomicrobiales bacterium]|nr:hypothetical protein [Verrucomicrobiales bacterium]
MNPLLHQLRTDLRHQRPWLIAFWATLPVQVLVAGLATPYFEVRTSLEVGLLLLQAFLAIVVIVRAVHADAFVGDTLFWKTRPVTPRTLLLAKSLLVLLGLLLPFTAAAMLGWTNAGVTAAKVPLGVLSLWLVVLPGIAIALAVAGLSRNLVQLTAVSGGLFAVFVMTLLVLSWLSAGGALVQRTGPVHISTLSLGLDASSSIGALGWLLAWSLAAWVLTSIRRSGVVGTLLVLAVVGSVTLKVTWHYGLLGRVSLPEVTLRVVPVPADDPAPDATEGQVLWSTFRIQGLATNQVTIAIQLEASLREEGRPRLRFFQMDPRWTEGRSDLLNSAQEADYLRTVQSAFPADTLWFGDWVVFARGSLPLAPGQEEVEIHGNPRGRFGGTLSLRLHEVRHLADVPLKRAEIRLDDETMVSLRRVSTEMDGIVIAVEERRTSFLLDPGLDRAGLARQRVAGLVYVLYQPTTGEAVVRDPDTYGWGHLAFYGGQTVRNQQLRFEFPRLQQHLTGMPMSEWLEGARLHIFDARAVGWAQDNFYIADFKLRMDGDVPGKADRQAGLARLKELTLSEDASDEQALAYVRTIDDLATQNREGNDWQLFREKLLALGTKHLDALIQRWPIHERIRSSAGNPVLGQFATRDHLPALLEALRRDPGLVWLFQQKHWEDDARPVLRDMLAGFRVPLPAGAVAVAAQGASPDLYPLLARRFILLERGHEGVAPVLEGLPGFDLAGTVRAAWKRALVGLADRAGLGVVAARYGLPQSLDSAIEAVDRGRRSSQEDVWSRQLREITGYAPLPDEKPEAFRDWLLSNWGRFAYDADRHGYRVE